MGLKDKRDQLNATVPVELFLRVWTGSLGGRWQRRPRPALDENGVTIAVCLYYVQPRKSETTSMRAPFRLRTGLGDSGKTWDGLFGVELGAGVCGDEVRQALGECGVPLVYTAPDFLQITQCSW